MKNRLTAAVMTVALAVPGIAEASSTNGLYLSAGAGGGIQEDFDATSAGVTNVLNFERPSPAIFGAIGYGFGNNIRTEVEASYRRSVVNEVTGTGAGNAVGTMNAVGILGNVLYDFEIGSIIKPYVGFGAGGAQIRSTDAGSVFGGDSFDDNPLHLAFQGIAGVSFEVNRQIDLTLDYRYFRTMEEDYDLASGATAKGEYINHTVMVGFRYNFFSEDWSRRDDWSDTKRSKSGRREAIREVVTLPETSPPASSYPYSQTPVYQQGTSASPVPIYTPPKATEFPPPVIVSGSPELYVVYFDYNRYDLSMDSKDTLVRAAGAFKNGGMARIEVTGHTDAAGSSRYNKRLSQRRADTVRKHLATLGVPKDAITTKAKGEDDLPIPTADGTKEAKNRRAEIVMN